MGDAAWLWKLDCEFRGFNYVGDTQWLTGVVTRKFRTVNGDQAVDLDVQTENQHGDVTTPGHATIILPSRQGGEVVLPDPPGGAGNLTEALGAIAEAFADGSAAPLR